MLTFHLCNTTWLGFIGTMTTMVTLGRYYALSYGASRFLALYGFGVAGSATATLLSLRHNSNATTSGGWGVASAFITFNLMKNPHWFRSFKYSNPLLLLTVMTLAALYFDNKSMVGGMTAGYLALLAAV